MLVSDVINFAISGEIQQLKVAEVSNTDPERRANETKLISYINLGILELYKKFGLAHQARTLDTVIDGATYNMPSDYLHLIYAMDNEDREIPINDEFSDYSLFEPAPFTLFVVKDDAKYDLSDTIYITYVAVPPLLTGTGDTVPLTYQYLEALLLYVSYKAHSPTEANDIQNQNKHYIKFLGACKEIQNKGLMTADNQSNYKHDDRGFG